MKTSIMLKFSMFSFYRAFFLISGIFLSSYLIGQTFTTNIADRCADAGVEGIFVNGSPIGGTYSGPGVTDLGTGIIIYNPGVGGTGIRMITYTTSAGSASVSTTVFALPTVSFTALPDLDFTDPVQNGLSGGTPLGSNGVYSGPGVSNNGNGTYDFDPAAAGIGTHTITFTYTTTDGCSASASDDVVVSAGSVTFTAPSDLCLNAGIQSGQSGGLPLGGVYSGPGVTDDGNGMTYTFNPVIAGSGIHTLTYTITGGAATDLIEVFAVPNTSFTIPPANKSYCFSAPEGPVFPIVNPANGGSFTGPGVTGVSGTLYLVNPSVAGTGTHIVSFSYTNANGCSSTSTDTYQVGNAANLTFTAPADVCEYEPIQSGLTGGISVAGIYSGPGVTDNMGSYTFDPRGAGVGIHTITFTDNTGCANMASDQIEILAVPVADFSSPTSVCFSQASMGVNFLDASTNASAWTWDFGNGQSSALQNPSTTYQSDGNYTVELIVDLGNGCMDTISKPLSIIESPTANFTVSSQVNCLLPQQITFTDQSLLPDTWTWNFGDGSASSLQNPTHSYTALGNYPVILAVQDTINNCIDSLTVNVNLVNLSPISRSISQIGSLFDAVALACANDTLQFDNVADFAESAPGTLSLNKSLIFSGQGIVGPKYSIDQNIQVLPGAVFNIQNIELTSPQILNLGTLDLKDALIRSSNPSNAPILNMNLLNIISGASVEID